MSTGNLVGMLKITSPVERKSRDSKISFEQLRLLPGKKDKNTHFNNYAARRLSNINLRFFWLLV